MTETVETPEAPIAPVAAPAKPTTVQVKQYIDEKKLREDIAYSTVDLSNAMQSQAALFVHYCTLAAQAAKQVDNLKLLLETRESMVYRSLRDHLVESKEKFTEAQLEKSVAAEKQIIAIKRAINEAKQIEAIAKGAVEAFRHRKDMLVQHGADLRMERQVGEMRTTLPLEELKRRTLEQRSGS